MSSFILSFIICFWLEKCLPQEISDTLPLSLYNHHLFEDVSSAPLLLISVSQKETWNQTTHSNTPKVKNVINTQVAGFNWRPGKGHWYSDKGFILVFQSIAKLGRYFPLHLSVASNNGKQMIHSSGRIQRNDWHFHALSPEIIYSKNLFNAVATIILVTHFTCFAHSVHLQFSLLQ